MSAGRKIHTQSQHWGTPEKYVRAVKEVLGGHIALDPCSNEFSIVGAALEYRLPLQDGLKETWNAPTIFVNPPYGLDHERGTAIRHWLQRCHLAHEQYGAEVLSLGDLQKVKLGVVNGSGLFELATTSNLPRPAALIS